MNETEKTRFYCAGRYHGKSLMSMQALIEYLRPDPAEALTPSPPYIWVDEAPSEDVLTLLLEAERQGLRRRMTKKKPIRLTFTGVDERTDLARVMRIGRQHPHVEFAVLVGSRTGQPGKNRYPGLSVVSDFRLAASDNGVRSAVHLCGRYSRAVMKQEWCEPLYVTFGFVRVQVNASHYKMGAVKAFADLTGKKVIVQWRGCEAQVYPEIAFLHDESGGRGVNGIKDWPLVGRWSGFAGGLNAENIAEAVAFVRATAPKGSWLDMETGVRTDDWFDLDKVDAVIAAAAEET